MRLPRPQRVSRGEAAVIRVLVADDHTLLRQGLRQLLERAEGFEVAGEAGTASETLLRVRNDEIDVLILDLSMPGRSGLELLRQIKAERPKLAVLVLSMHAEELYAVRALAAGASGYLTKDAGADQLLAALRRLAAGGRHISDTVAELLAQEIGTRTPKPTHHELSDREFQVLHWLVAGESVSAISRRLHLSVKTVSTHKTNLLRKLRCTSLADLMHYAITHGITAGTRPPT